MCHNGRGSEALCLVSPLSLLFRDATSFLGCAHLLLDFQQELVDTSHVTLVSLASVLSGSVQVYEFTMHISRQQKKCFLHHFSDFGMKAYVSQQ
jgi:hypothetical protein